MSWDGSRGDNSLSAIFQLLIAGRYITEQLVFRTMVPEKSSFSTVSF